MKDFEIFEMDGEIQGQFVRYEDVKRIEKENEVLHRQLVALKYYLPKPLGEAEDEEYKFEIERLTMGRLDKLETWQLKHKIIDLTEICFKLRQRLQLQRQYNAQGWRSMYFNSEKEKELLRRNLKITETLKN